MYGDILTATICEHCGKPTRKSKRLFWKDARTGERTPFYPYLHKKCAILLGFQPAK